MKNDFDKKLHRMMIIALFGAMAYVVMLLIHIPVGFLTLDVKDALIALCGLYFGPMAAFLLAVLVPLLELVTVSGTGFYGLIMNILGTISFAFPAALIYKYRKNFSGAMIGIVTSIFTMTAVMILANLFITPYYMGVSVQTVASMIPKVFLPFNLVKAVLNAGIVLLLYKHLSRVLQRAGFLPLSKAPYRFDRRSLLVSVVAVVMIIAAFVIIFAVLHGSLEFGIKGA